MDKSGKTFRVFSAAYRPGPVGPFKFLHDLALHAGKLSDDGHVYIGGFTVRMNADGTNAEEIIGQNYRNSYEQSVTSLGDVFQNDNDDPPACVSWVMSTRTSACRRWTGSGRQADRRPGRRRRWRNGGRTILA